MWRGISARYMKILTSWAISVLPSASRSTMPRSANLKVSSSKFINFPTATKKKDFTCFNYTKNLINQSIKTQQKTNYKFDTVLLANSFGQSMTQITCPWRYKLWMKQTLSMWSLWLLKSYRMKSNWGILWLVLMMRVNGSWRICIPCIIKIRVNLEGFRKKGDRPKEGIISLSKKISLTGFSSCLLDWCYPNSALILSISTLNPPARDIKL